MCSACLFFIEKPQNQKARIFRQGKNIINKKKIIKLEVLKRWQSDYKTKKQPDYRTAEICFTVVLLSMRF